MKRFMWVLTIVALLGFASCGGESSAKAKELLQKILNLIGIPQHIVVNICQDEDRNGLCEAYELQAKVTINRGDDMDTILQKLTDNKDGSYFLETYDSTLPLLLVLEDSGTVHYDGGRSTLNYSGFENSEDKKELSILQSMIDAGHLKSQDVEAVRNLNTEYAQNRFYETLFKDLETNINTLREEELTATEAMSGNIKEMAEELIDNNVTKELPDRINACVDSACVDKEVEGLSDNLIIHEEEAVEVKEEQTGGTSATNTPTDNNEDLSKGLVAHYKFDGNANDSSGNNTPITISNAIYYIDGKLNKSIGSTDISASEQIEILNPFNNEKFAISFWSNPLVKHNKIYGDSHIHVWHSTDTNQRSFIFAMSSGSHSIYHQHEYPELAVNDNKNNAGNGDSFYYGDNQLAEQEWQHIVLSYDNGVIDVYVNGNKIIQNQRTIVSPIGRNLSIALRGEDKIDDFKIYNRVLNESEIQELYNLKQ